MRLAQRIAISGLLSVILIVLLTGTFVTRRDIPSLVDRVIGSEERPDQLNPPWIQDNNNDPRGRSGGGREDDDEGGGGNDSNGHNQTPTRNNEDSMIGTMKSHRNRLIINKLKRISLSPGRYIIPEPNPPLDDLTHQRREKIKEVIL